ncbi:MAG: tetratricopeptide repeat protein [Candidatus Obscuribacterales bacterium]|nr:tetratricopeptide repeat protein [Candidatus Obscuribacterales bacterium]
MDSNSGKWQEYMDAGNEAFEKRRLAEVERLYCEAIKEAVKFADDDPRLAYTYNNYAALCHSQGKYAFAENYYQKAMAINEKNCGADSLEVAQNLHNLAIVYSAKLRYDEAERLYQRSLAIKEKRLGVEHKDLVSNLKNYAQLLKRMKRDEEAVRLEQRAAAIAQS